MEELELENEDVQPAKIGEEGLIRRILESLRINVNRVDQDLTRIDFIIEELEKRKRLLSERKDYEVEKINELEAHFDNFAEKMAAKSKSRIRSVTYPLKKELRALRKENKQLAELADIQLVSFDSVEQEAIAKARTIAIFESILFAIENWATDDVPATDFTPVAQAVLFKAVYVPVMCGNTDYYMDAVPFSATEVVKRGREYVKALRSESQTPLTDTSMQLTAQQYQQWWINDALVLLYGDRDPEWEETKPHTLEEMELWKSTDMDKTMHFPKIFDAFELTRKYGDEIRESSGLPDFTKQIMQTRLTTYE